ncbi:hypothetical protein [Candidatus Tisiphia endosymbiont of Oplodontha viridula]|uniref:hypothetical protein n=1 Tax=Candidatus Tisiphia endosymbiont of Oplodontha viridula TaxID=3077925 RepID=UPI0035C90F89
MNNHKVSDIAKALQLSERRVQQLVKEAILPTPVAGKYDLADCIKSYARYLESRPVGKNTSDNLNAQKLRLLKAQADKAELEVQILEGKYLASSEVELHWSNLIIAFRARMLSLPNNIARQIIVLDNDFAAIVHCLETEIHKALLELSNYGTVVN